MNGMIKKAWIGLMLGLGLLAAANGYAAADLTIASAPTALTAGNALVFAAPQQIGTVSAAQTVTLTASGGTVNFDAFGIANSNFSMVTDCGTSLASSANPPTCSFTVTFTPEMAGTRYAELVIRSNAASSPQTIYLQGTATKAPQTITFGAAPTIIVGGTGTVTATASSGLPVTFTSTTPSVCSVSGSTVTGVIAGTCTIAANQAGDGNNDAATQVTQNITVTNKTAQTITNLTVPTISVGGTGTITATGGGSGNPVTFTSTTTDVCTVSGTNGSTVTGVAPGTCTIIANQLGNATYDPAGAVTASGTVNSKSSQTIAFGTVPTISVGGTGTVTATASSGLPVTFTSTTPGVCTVSGSTVTGVAASSSTSPCTIAANQAGNATFNAAPQVTTNVTVNAAVAGSGNCSQYGITTNTVLPLAGNTGKPLPISATQGYSLSFTTGALGTSGYRNNQYAGVTSQYVTISTSQCDYDAPAPLCAKQGGSPVIYYKVGGTSTYQCILQPNTTYYYNVRDASRDASGNWTNTCTAGNCSFWAY